MAVKQQYMKDYERGGPCYICGCIDKKRIIHHVKYNPEEVVLLCISCHGYLHARFLGREKVKPY